MLQVLELYKTPLRVEGWDSALIETTRQRREACQGDLAAYCGDVQSIPTLILTGTQLRQKTAVLQTVRMPSPVALLQHASPPAPAVNCTARSA